MTFSTNSPQPVRKQCHITDLFFRSELAQLAGSDAGDKWFREQSRGAALCRSDGLPRLPPGSNPTSPRPAMCATSHRTADTEGPKPGCNLPNKDSSNPMYLSMDEDLPLHLESSKIFQDCESDIGLLFTDAAHKVLTRLSSRASN
jgi:hypothetical protein